MNYEDFLATKAVRAQPCRHDAKMHAKAIDREQKQAQEQTDGE